MKVVLKVGTSAELQRFMKQSQKVGLYFFLFLIDTDITALHCQR